MTEDATTPHLGAFDAILPDEATAKAAFAETCAFVWRDAFAAPLFARLTALCGRSGFTSDHVEGLGHREIEEPPLAGTAIILALTRPVLFRWLERVTGCAPIRGIDGRVVQTWPRAGDGLDWHDDLGDPARRLGVTIALGDAAYDGGEFEMRRTATKVPLIRWKHDRPGTMLVFEVSRHREHRVHPLTAGGPRRVFTGWFVG